VLTLPRHRCGPHHPRLHRDHLGPRPGPCQEAPAPLTGSSLARGGCGAYRRCIGWPMASQHTTMRCQPWGRLPLLAGPVSLGLWRRVRATCGASSTAVPQAASVSPLPARVLAALPKVRRSGPPSASTIPQGVACSCRPRAGSQASESPRVRPPRGDRPARPSRLTSATQPVDRLRGHRWWGFVAL
jgi:hypothetical protein